METKYKLLELIDLMLGALNCQNLLSQEEPSPERTISIREEGRKVQKGKNGIIELFESLEPLPQPNHPSEGVRKILDEVHVQVNRSVCGFPDIDLDRVKDLAAKAISTLFSSSDNEGGAQERYGKLWSDEDGHDYIIPESIWEEFSEFVNHLTTIGCNGEPSEAYFVALEHLDKIYGQYQIDGAERDFRILLPDRIAAGLDQTQSKQEEEEG